MSELSISSELIDHLIALAQSRNHARQPGQWVRFVGQLEALRTGFSTDDDDYTLRLYSAEFRAVIATSNSLMLDRTRSVMLDLIAENADRNPPLNSEQATDLETLFDALGRPSHGRWTKEVPTDLSDPNAQAAELSAASAVAGFIRSHEPADLAETIGWLEKLARLMPQRTTHPIHRYWPFNHFQTLLGEPIARSMDRRQCGFFAQVLLGWTAWEFDPSAYEAADGRYEPWHDPANGVEFKSRWNSYLVSFKPLDHCIYTKRWPLDPRDGPWLKPEYEAHVAEWLLAEEERKRQRDAKFKQSQEDSRRRRGLPEV